MSFRSTGHPATPELNQPMWEPFVGALGCHFVPPATRDSPTKSIDFGHAVWHFWVSFRLADPAAPELNQPIWNNSLALLGVISTRRPPTTPDLNPSIWGHFVWHFWVSFRPGGHPRLLLALWGAKSARRPPTTPKLNPSIGAILSGTFGCRFWPVGHLRPSSRLAPSPGGLL